MCFFIVFFLFTFSIEINWFSCHEFRDKKATNIMKINDFQDTKNL